MVIANEISGERKCKRVKVRERERGGSGARRTDPLTEGLEQATVDPACACPPLGCHVILI